MLSHSTDHESNKPGFLLSFEFMACYVAEESFNTTSELFMTSKAAFLSFALRN